jgi:ATP-dependent RNA helicase DHR2
LSSKMPEKIHTRFDEGEASPTRLSKNLKYQPTSGLRHTTGSAKKRKRDEDASSKRSLARRVVNPNPSLAETPSPNPNPKASEKHDSNLDSRLVSSRPSGGRPSSTKIAMSASLKESPTKAVVSSLKEKAKTLSKVRQNLPIYPHGEEIQEALRATDVLLLVGETGSGKSTQVPQFLLSEPWCKSQGVGIPTDGLSKTSRVSVGGRIAITQPRRVAAISLARRVAEEMGTPLGSSSPASKVGYSVRFDNSTSPSTRIKFLTEGMLLQEMLTDPWLREYSAVIVDEVHERGVNADLVLGFMRRMVAGNLEGRGRVGLKVVIMSATAEMESIRGFFEDGFERDKKSDAESEWDGFSDDDESEPKDASMTTHRAPPDTKKHVSVCHISGRQYPVRVIYSPNPVPDFVDAALQTIFQIHHKEPLPGDVLVFLTGQETVETLEALVNEHALTLDRSVPKMLVLPLFAALSQTSQQRVFLPAPPKTRKIILATNIAETSVTVSGVRHVIDCGKAKMKQFRSRLGLDSLLVKPISRSSAIQRKGRAGREAPGTCYRLYTEKDYLSLQHSNTPEILRCDLSQSILTMKARGVTDITTFPFLAPPPRDSLEKALLQLHILQALDGSGNITPLGLQIAKMPLSAPLGSVLLAAAEPKYDCLAEVIDIVSCLSVENVFLSLTSEEKKEEAEAARKKLFRREGDHLTLLATVRAYVRENADRKAWAEKHFISHRAMQAVMVFSLPLPSVTTQCITPKTHKHLPRMFANNSSPRPDPASFSQPTGSPPIPLQTQTSHRPSSAPS